MKRVDLRKENCIFAMEKLSCHFISAFSALKSLSSFFLCFFFFLCFEHKMFQSSGMVHLCVPNHGVPSLYQLRSNERKY